MAKWVPFTAHIKVVPDRGKRFEYIRSLQRTSVELFEELDADADLELASPGGSQYQSGVGATGLSSIKNGMAAKPQFGESPAQLMITGFLSSDGKNNPVYADKPVIHSGGYAEGVGSHPWNSNPTSTTDSYASSIADKIEAALTAVSAPADWRIYKLEVAGVMYGASGFHIPR